MAGFYAARDNTMPPLPWPSIAPPFTLPHSSFARSPAISSCRRSQAVWAAHIPSEGLQWEVNKRCVDRVTALRLYPNSWVSARAKRSVEPPWAKRRSQPTRQTPPHHNLPAPARKCSACKIEQIGFAANSRYLETKGRSKLGGQMLEKKRHSLSSWVNMPL